MSGRRATEPRAIVFDLDDTLYPQASFKRSGLAAVAQWLEDHGHTDADSARKVLFDILDRLGPSHPALLDQALVDLQVADVHVQTLVSVFRNHRPRVALYPGVETLLRGLRPQRRLGLLTDGLASVQRRKVEALGLTLLLDDLLFSDELGAQKPAMALFEWFERRLQLREAALMYVGDNPDKDFIGARSRGWQTVRVLTGEHAGKVPASAQHAADHQIEGVADLPSLLVAIRAGQGRPTVAR